MKRMSLTDNHKDEECENIPNARNQFHLTLPPHFFLMGELIDSTDYIV